MNKVDEFILLVQKEVCKVNPTVENAFTNSKYADLEDVLDLLNPLFREHNVLLIQSPEFIPGAGWALVTTLQREGEGKQWTYPLLGLDGKNAMQSLGSATTYARRYQLKGIFKLVDSDDDANRVTASGEASKPARKSDVDKMLRAFAAAHVTKEEIEARYQLDVDQFTAEEMEDLKNVFKELKSGKKDKTKYFSGEKSWQE